MERDKPEEKIRLTKRKFVKACIGASAAAALGGTTISLLKASLPPELQASGLTAAFKYYVNKDEKREGKLWYANKGEEEAKAVDFQIGKGASTIWRGNIPAIILKLEKGKFKNRVEGVVEDKDGVVVAFSAKCVHLCCLPNWMKSKPDFDNIYCPCHDSVYDPYDIVEEEYKNEKTGEVVKYLGARRIAGPAPRSLPMIPIEIKDGKIMGLPAALAWLAYCGLKV